jgi:branched-chain amino acid transport system permease protein
MGRLTDLVTGQRRWLTGCIALAAVVVLLTMPSLVGIYQLYICCLVLVMATAGLGLVVIMGWTGQVALAQAGFLGIGAYGTTYLVGHGWSWVAATVVTAMVASLIGAIIGLPAIRMRGFYLAIATLAFASLLQTIFIEASSITDGDSGVAVTPILIGSLGSAASRWYVCLAVAAVSALLVWRMGGSAMGRRMRTVRDAEVAAPSFGVSPTTSKLFAFAVSALIGSLAGSAYAQCVTFLVPSIFGFTLLLSLLVVVFVGGINGVAGPFLGAIVVIALRQVLENAGEWQNLSYGVLLALSVAFLPLGIASLPRRLTLIRVRRPRAEKSPAAAAPPRDVKELRIR